MDQEDEEGSIVYGHEMNKAQSSRSFESRQF